MSRKRDPRGTPRVVDRQVRRSPTALLSWLLVAACTGLVVETGVLLGWRRPPSAVATTPSDLNVVDVSIADLQQALASGQLTSRALTLQYLARIAVYGKLLNPAIAVNRHALELAARAFPIALPFCAVDHRRFLTMEH